ncbi:hypothetical protein LOTGIDRAFT_237883 [Lottia gigantea]|uniref:SAM domain-containing protein n=1 Tax=Lottia gigantea TaxID=225164 RepID=V4BA34_LOTGI|nr:hypothetical protein LOTGIDRAFT_237883 [Lottia gigantea]ESP02652.1 hypothetical protein LOTGIDRAFT_237883 [Lottia gigantea]
MNIPPEPLTKDVQRFIRFTNEDNDMEVMEFYERYGRKLPLLMIVTIGNYADTDLETFSGDQTFRLAHISRQKRVIARDIKGRYLTIPANFPMKFRTVRGRKNVGDVQTLARILEDNELPCIVQFAASAKAEFKIGANNTKCFNFGNIVLTEIYDEKYFLANCVDSAGMMLERVVLVPLYVKEISVAAVNGIMNGDEQDFKNFQIGLNKAAEKFHFDLESGNNDIAMLPEDCEMITSNNIYDYIDPKSFVDIKRRQSSTSSASDNVDVSQPDEKPALPPRQTVRKTSSTPLSPKSPVSGGKSKTKCDSEPDEAFFSGGSIFQNPDMHHRPRQGQFSGDEMSISGGSIGSFCPTDFVLEFCISDISEALTKLHLDKYVKPLKEAQIDGPLLLTLDEPTLVEDFKMKTYEAKKLLLFAKTGHIPK